MEYLEKYIYNLVKNNAFIKNILVVVYQSLFCFFGLIKGKIITEYKYTEIRNSFFGFHDRASMNTQGEVLSHVATNQFENGIGRADITVTDINSGDVSIVGSTLCCNYQQGSLLTWFSDSQIVFNDVNEDGPITVIKNLQTNSQKVLPFHFFSLSPDSKFISSVNFYRFGKGLDGYGYDIKYPSTFVQDGEDNLSHNEISDFVIFNIEEDKVVYRLSIKEAEKRSNGLIGDGYYYFSHSCFSPASNQVYFLLRSSNNLYNTSQLFSYNLTTNVLSVLPSGGMVSHLSWLSDVKIIAFCNALNDKAFAYYIFDLSDNSVKSINIAGLNKDGHPYAQCSDVFYTDTYPDKERRQSLYCVDLKKKSFERILSIYSPLNYRGVGRVDLHPRMSLCKKYITIDSSHNSDRSQLILDLRKQF